jgi:hypothetical protein
VTIADYLDAIKTRPMTDPSVAAFRVERERSTGTDGYMRVRVTLGDDSQLEFAEHAQLNADHQIDVVTHNYHWADSANRLIQRWDNTPHHPGLAGFPHHIHGPASNAPGPGRAMTVISVLDEVSQRLQPTAV